MIPSRYLMLCRLKELMTERRVLVSDLEEDLGLTKQTIANLRNNSWKLLYKKRSKRSASTCRCPSISSSSCTCATSGSLASLLRAGS